MQADTDRCLLESALELSSTELFEANEELREILNELTAEREKLQYLATRDSLTGIWNRRANHYGVAKTGRESVSTCS